MLLAPGRVGRIGITQREGMVSPLAALLFGNGEDGFLFGNFGELDELFTASIGPTNIVANDDPVGLALDDHGWGGQTLAQVVAAAAELKAAGAPTLLGSATAATYNTGTGVGSVTRVDGSNQSYVTVPVTNGKTYAVNITATQAILIRNTIGGAGLVIASAGTTATYFIVGASSAIVFTYSGAAGTANFILNSIREVPGNHALQATAANRPLWKANAGKPYLSADGTNDALIPQFYPFASGTGLTMAAAFNATALSSIAIGGGNTATNKRATMGLQSNGQLSVGWGTEIAESVIVDRRNVNQVMLVTGDVTGREVWLNGQNVTSLFVAASGFPDNTGGALAIGGRQNSAGGSTDRNLGGNLFAALTVNRRVTLAEIARITSDFQRTF